MDIDKYIDQRTAPADRPHFTRETQPAGPIRSRQIYISHENDWILMAIVKAHRGHHMDATITKDQLADSILSGYFSHNHPELRDLYKQRQEIDNQAVKTAGEKSKP